MSSPSRVRALPALLCLLAGLPAGAEVVPIGGGGGGVPRLVGLHGRLLRADGTAATGTASAAYSIYDAETGGSALWQESQTLGLSDGYYSTFLGLVTVPPDALFDGGARWLEVRFESETLTPRIRLGSVPYALTAQSVSGGSANVMSLQVGGQTVVDAGGHLAGSARYVGGEGIAVDDMSQTISLVRCPPNTWLISSADDTWQCRALPRADAIYSGYLYSEDWARFDAKYDSATQCGGDLSGPLAAPVVARLQSKPVSNAAPSTGQVLKWNGTVWQPSTDAGGGGTVTSVTGIAPVTVWLGTVTPEISLPQANAGGDGYLAAPDWQRFDAKFDAQTQCGGDLEGALASPVVAKLQGIRVDTAAPAAAQVLRFDGSRWTPASLGISDVGGLSSGYLDLSGTQIVAGSKTFATAPTFAPQAGNVPFTVGAGMSGRVDNLNADRLDGFEAADFVLNSAGIDASGIVSGTLAVARGGTGASVAFARGSIVFAGSGGAYTQNNPALFWDDANGRLGIGTNAPSKSLHVLGNAFLSGNVGIGSTDPQAALHVAGTTGAASSLMLQNTSGGGGTWRLGEETPGRLSVVRVPGGPC